MRGNCVRGVACVCVSVGVCEMYVWGECYECMYVGYECMYVDMWTMSRVAVVDPVDPFFFVCFSISMSQ